MPLRIPRDAFLKRRWATPFVSLRLEQRARLREHKLKRGTGELTSQHQLKRLAQTHRTRLVLDKRRVVAVVFSRVRDAQAARYERRVVRKLWGEIERAQQATA